MFESKIGRLIDARRDDRHPHRLLESGVDDRAHDDVSFLVDFLAYPARAPRPLRTASDPCRR